MVTNCILGIFRLRRRMRSDFAQDDRGERPFQFPWSWRCRQFVKKLFAVGLYPSPYVWYFAEIPCCGMVTNCILGIFRLRRRMRSDFAQDDRGERPFTISAILVMPGDFGDAGNIGDGGNIGNAGNSLGNCLRNCLLLNFTQPLCLVFRRNSLLRHGYKAHPRDLSTASSHALRLRSR